MQSSRTQPRRESFIRTDTDSAPSSRHAVVNHTRILSRFFLSSLDRTMTGSAGHMKLKVTKASAAAASVDNRLNKPKTLPHSLYEDPAFSADPSSNPLCSASHDINYWITDPPKGHPTVNPLPDQRNSFSLRKVTPIPPPNSPVSLHDRQQAPFSMISPTSTSNVSPPSTSPPDLSLTGSSASDLSLKTPGTSRSSLNISQTSAPSAENKKRIGLSFFKRRSNSERTPIHRLVKHTKTMSLNPTTGSKPDSHSPSVMTGPGETMKGVANGEKPTVFTAQSARALDMIDELDESNPLGISLHHGGPYEAIQKIVGSNPYGRPRAPSKPERQQRSLHSHPFRFDVPLNLSPGQVLPHSVTAYYRPQVRSDSAISFHDRLGLQPTISNQPVDQVPLPAMNWNAVDRSDMAQSAMNVPTRTNHPRMHIPPSNPGLAQPFPLQSEPAIQTQLIDSRDRVCDPHVLSDGEPRMTPPLDEMGELAIDGGRAAVLASIDPDACESSQVTEESDDRTRIGEQLVTGEYQDTDDEDQGELESVSDDPIAHNTPGESGDTRLPYLEKAEAQSRFSPHESLRNTPPPPPLTHGPSGNTAPMSYGPPSNTSPPPNMFLSPPASGSSGNIAPMLYGPPRDTPPPPDMFISPPAPGSSGNIAPMLYGPPRHTPPPPDMFISPPAPGSSGNIAPMLYGPPRDTPPPPDMFISPPTPGPSRNIPPISYGPPINTPLPPNMFLSPPAPHDPYRRQELPSDRRVYQAYSSAPSSSSSIRSGAASTMTSFTGRSSVTSNPRNRILPRQLVMPAPLAKATASSRPQPTHLPQSVQVLRDVQKQHRIRFDDGTLYDLPVTTSTQINPNWAPSSLETPSARPVETQTRTPSIMRSGKLRKHKSLRGPEPPEMVARLAAAPQVGPGRKYMEPPPTIPEAPKIEGYTPKYPVKRLLGKRNSIF